MINSNEYSSSRFDYFDTLRCESWTGTGPYWLVDENLKTQEGISQAPDSTENNSAGPDEQERVLDKEGTVVQEVDIEDSDWIDLQEYDWVRVEHKEDMCPQRS